MEKFENVDYNELGFDPHIYGLLTDWRWLSGLQWNSLLADLVGSYRSQRISKSKQSNLEVNYGSVENASIVYAALAVDKELQPDKVKRHMSVSDGKLMVHFEAVEARLLRASFSAFVDVLTLATKTIEEFGSDMKLQRLN
ncbi:hypothetical protein Scep_025403 [Stephania cephalantha]|uniref:Uncharacterized protein n=1 Tax=Stephania cephalantha TaxID=152367 RepID=A0AAP0EIM4_9MAGN